MTSHPSVVGATTHRTKRTTKTDCSSDLRKRTTDHRHFTQKVAQETSTGVSSTYHMSVGCLVETAMVLCRSSVSLNCPLLGKVALRKVNHRVAFPNPTPRYRLAMTATTTTNRTTIFIAFTVGHSVYLKRTFKNA
jgi:hypothetical protein